VAVAAFAAPPAAAAAAPAAPAAAAGPASSPPAGNPAPSIARSCPAVPARRARCLAEVVTASGGVRPLVASGPDGFGPADLWSAYRLSASPGTPPAGGAGATIAIVDSYDDPNAASDLATYRSTYGLPACTTATGCLRKVNQAGGTTYPRADSGWAQEISLDLDMASAACPACRILLVEASSDNLSDLGAAVDRAALMGATQISNSYGGSEYSGEVSDQSHYNHPGIDITVSAGDDGYRAEFPAASQYVTAVGGTSLIRDTSARGWHESVWSGSGSGCSAYVAKPSWQTDTGCPRRTVADVAAVADPQTGVAVYDTYAGTGGWVVFGGTSVSAPLVAGVDALAGGRAGAPNSYGSFAYANRSAFFDVVAGSDGSCTVAYLCAAGPGYDGPTGWGTPNGAGVGAPAPRASTTAVSCAPASVAVGAASRCTATVTDSAATGPASSPQGTVSFATTGSGSFSAVSCALVAGGTGAASCAVSYTPSAVGSGTHQVTAGYAGDHVGSSASTPVTVTPGSAPRPSTIAVVCAPGAVTVGHPTTCTATVTDSGPAATRTVPAGSIAFSRNSSGSFSATSCTPTASGAGQATCAVTYTPGTVGTGSHKIYVNYTGDHTASAGSTTVTVS
jgi:hypothetical protein